MAATVRARRRRRPAPLVVGAAVATAVAVLPLAYLVVRATERGWAGVRQTLGAPGTLDLLVASIVLAAVVTAASVVIGVALAWLVARTDVPLRRFWRVALALPLALPSYVAAYAWIGWDDGLSGLRGSALVLTTISYPFVYLPVLAALQRADPALEDAARTLGHSPWSVFVRVTLPQVRPATVGGALLVGLYALSDFGAVAIMRHDVLTRAIYNSYRASFDRTPAAVLGCVLATLAIVVVAIEAKGRRSRSAIARSGGGAARRPATTALGRWRLPAALVPAAVLGASLGVPARGLLSWFGDGASRPDWARLGEATASSLQVGVLGAIAVVALAFPVAVLAVRHPGRLSGVASGAAYAGHALPGVVVGLALVFFGIRWAGFAYQELPMLIVAYVVLYLSLGLGAIQATVASIAPALEDVARTLGRTRAQVWWSITARLAAPGLGAAAALVLLTILKELPATLFLRPTGFDTLATGLWSELSSFQRAAAAPYAAAIVVLASIPTAVLVAIGERREGR